MAQDFSGSAGGDRVGCERDSADAAVAVVASAVRARYWKRAGHAQYGYRHPLDVPHAGFELCVFCSIALAGGTGGGGVDGGSAAFFAFAASAAALRGDMGAGGRNGGFSGGGAYCVRTLWAVFVVEGSGAGDCGESACSRSRDDLWRS